MILPERLAKAALHLSSSATISGTRSSVVRKRRLCSLWSEKQYVTKAKAFSTSTAPSDPIISIPDLQSALTKHAPDIQKSLSSNGFFATNSRKSEYDILPRETIQVMRQQAINLRKQGRFEQSWSEKIDATGVATRFDKDGVFACEPDGRDYDTAPDLITYMSVVLQTLPDLLNAEGPNHGLSVSSFNAKLAVTSPGGSTYPLHIDNPQGLAVGDTRKLTCILYLNPDYKVGDGGELRMLINSDTNSDDDVETIDFTPCGGRLILFWSDEIPHEVLPTAPTADISDEQFDRYALTIWIPTDNHHTILSGSSKWAALRDKAF
jgi:Rps23 Pro-64 3,4-dihydroxylase Tpa1-like proline 4-hydroxylase